MTWKQNTSNSFKANQEKKKKKEKKRKKERTWIERERNKNYLKEFCDLFIVGYK